MLHDKMCINIRNKEEQRAFLEVAQKEGIKWADGLEIEIERNMNTDVRCYGIGYWRSMQLTYGSSVYNQDNNGKLKIYEAADLFGNYLISKRIKEGKT